MLRYLAILMLVGCPKDAPSGPDWVTEAEAIKDQMCACKNAACVARVDELVAVHAKKSPPVSDEDGKKLVEIAGKTDRCRAKAIATPSPRQ